MPDNFSEQAMMVVKACLLLAFNYGKARPAGRGSLISKELALHHRANGFSVSYHHNFPGSSGFGQDSGASGQPGLPCLGGGPFPFFSSSRVAPIVWVR